MRKDFTALNAKPAVAPTLSPGDLPSEAEVRAVDLELGDAASLEEARQSRIVKRPMRPTSGAGASPATSPRTGSKPSRP